MLWCWRTSCSLRKEKDTAGLALGQGLRASGPKARRGGLGGWLVRGQLLQHGAKAVALLPQDGVFGATWGPANLHVQPPTRRTAAPSLCRMRQAPDMSN